MANWINLIKERYLSVDKMNAIYNDFLFINEALENKGYSIFEINDNSVTYGINPNLILDKMNAVEDNIQLIESTVDWINPYYSVYKWAHNTFDKKSEVDRWIMYLNFVYEVLSGNIPPLQYLTDINGYYITDIEGNYILVYKGDEPINE